MSAISNYHISIILLPKTISLADDIPIFRGHSFLYSMFKNEGSNSGYSASHNYIFQYIKRVHSGNII